MRTWIYTIINYTWSLFLNGLLTILPITLTIAIFNVSFRLLKGWVEPLQQIAPPFLSRIPHGEIILLILIIFAIGTILKIFVLRTIIHIIEDILARLPLVRPIYSGLKQLIRAFSGQDMLIFQKVVLIEFPRKGIYSLGFLTNEVQPELSPNKEEKFFSVYVPTTPNPTSGYFIMLPEKNISFVNITRQEAMALIISGGIIQPERLTR